MPGHPDHDAQHGMVDVVQLAAAHAALLRNRHGVTEIPVPDRFREKRLHRRLADRRVQRAVAHFRPGHPGNGIARRRLGLVDFGRDCQDGGLVTTGFGGVGGTTHGQGDRLRAPGSIGQSSYPSRVFRGMRMAGRTGGKRVTYKNLTVVRVIPESNILIVKGAVPGMKKSLLEIYKQAK